MIKHFEYLIMTYPRLQDVASEICLVDMVENKLKGEMMDLQHGLAFVKNVRINASTNYAITANSKVYIYIFRSCIYIV